MGRKVAECGTPSGYARHRRAGETACQDCKDAAAADARARYRPRSPRPRKEPAAPVVVTRIERQVLVRWLLPPAELRAVVEYAVLRSGDMQPVTNSDDVPRLVALGYQVFARQVSPWRRVGQREAGEATG